MTPAQWAENSAAQWRAEKEARLAVVVALARFVAYTLLLLGLWARGCEP